MAIARLATCCCIALTLSVPATATAADAVPWLFSVAGTGSDTDGTFRPGAFATATEIGAYDVAALPDGGFLVADTVSFRVTRVRPDGRIVLAAGGGRTTRDGVRATDARVDPVDVATLADGSYVIADAITARVRRVGLDGRIASISPRVDGLKAVDAVPGGGFVVAGATQVRRFAPDGTMTVVAGGEGQSIAPDAVAALAGGGFVIADRTNNRVSRVAPDGTMTPVALPGRTVPVDVAALPSGGFLIAGIDRVLRVDPRGVVRVAAGRAEGEGIFFGQPASRSTLDVQGVAVLDPDAVLVADGSWVLLVTGSRSPSLGLELSMSEDRATGRRFSTQVAVSRAARLELGIFHAGRRLARSGRTATRRGRVRLEARNAFAPAIDTVRVVASSGGRRTSQSMLVALGGVLLDRWASKAAGLLWTTPATAADDPEPDPTQRRVATCRRMSRHRIDCMREATDDEGFPPFRCAEIVAVWLMDGGIFTNEYRCPAFKQEPSWNSEWWSPVDLTAFGRG